jgi:hypothetical protein
MMSDATVKEIIERAVEDESFRQQLFNSPDQALKGYDLTGEERARLKSLNKDNFDDFAGDLGDRSTKGWLHGPG